MPEADSSLLPFVWIKNEDTNRFQLKKLASKELLLQLNQFREFLDKRHTEVADLRKRIRDESRGRYNSRKGIRAISFTVGDLVLVSTEALSGRRSKIQLNWVGPYVVTRGESEHVYEVKGMDGKSFLCHVQRMKFYDTVTSVIDQKEVLMQFIHDRSQFEVDKLRDARWNPDSGVYELLVEWRVLEKHTWEPAETLLQDIPEVVHAYLEKHADDDVVQRIQEKYC